MKTQTTTDKKKKSSKIAWTFDVFWAQREWKQTTNSIDLNYLSDCRLFNHFLHSVDKFYFFSFSFRSLFILLFFFRYLSAVAVINVECDDVQLFFVHFGSFSEKYESCVCGFSCSIFVLPPIFISILLRMFITIHAKFTIYSNVSVHPFSCIENWTGLSVSYLIREERCIRELVESNFKPGIAATLNNYSFVSLSSLFFFSYLLRLSTMQ